MLFMYNIDIADHVSGIPQTSGRLNITIDKSDAVSPNWSTMYKMTSEPRGYCLIINNRYFTGMYSYTFFHISTILNFIGSFISHFTSFIFKS